MNEWKWRDTMIWWCSTVSSQLHYWLDFSGNEGLFVCMCFPSSACVLSWCSCFPSQSNGKQFGRIDLWMWMDVYLYVIPMASSCDPVKIDGWKNIVQNSLETVHFLKNLKVVHRTIYWDYRATFYVVVLSFIWTF